MTAPSVYKVQRAAYFHFRDKHLICSTGPAVPRRDRRRRVSDLCNTTISMKPLLHSLFFPYPAPDNTFSSVTGLLLAGVGHVTEHPDSQRNFLVCDSKTEKSTIVKAFNTFTRERKDIGIVLINQHVCSLSKLQRCCKMFYRNVLWLVSRLGPKLESYPN